MPVIAIAALLLTACDHEPTKRTPAPPEPESPDTRLDPPEQARPNFDDPSTWSTVLSARLGFSVRMPPRDEADPDLETRDSVNLYSRPEGMEGPWFVVQVHPTFRDERELRTPRQIERFLEAEADVAVAFDPWGRPNYLGGGPETLYGHPGYATAETVNEPYPSARLGWIRTRVVLVGERVFVLQVRARGGRPTQDSVNAFFDSFELLAAPAAAPP
jgi:hypothetical protein